MKRQGFTLIELLAVIVVLAIIALIATPIVMNTIESSKKGATIESVRNMVHAAELYFISEDPRYGKLNLLDDKLDYDGQKPELGEIEVNKDGDSRVYAYINGYCVTKEYDSELYASKTNKEECNWYATDNYETTEGTVFTLNNQKIKNYLIYGNSTQDTRSGKNLFDYSYLNSTYSINGLKMTSTDDVITINGTLNKQGNLVLSNDFPNKFDTSKTYTLKIHVIGGNAVIGEGTGITFAFALFNSTNTKFVRTDVSSTSLDNIASVTFSGSTFEGDENLHLLFQNWRLESTYNNYQVKIQIEEGSTATEYEEYGAMPSPEFPSEIKNTGDLLTKDNCESYGSDACDNIGKYVVQVKATGKNLFDYDNVSSVYGVKKQDNGYYTNYMAYNMISTYQTLKKYIGKKVTVSFDLTTSKDGTFSIYPYQRNGIGINFSMFSKEIKANTKTRVTATGFVEVLGTNPAYSLGEIIVYNEGYKGSYLVNNIQFEVGEQATDYEAYNEKTTNIYLTEPLRKVGDTADYIDYANSKVVRNVGKTIFNGSENWIQYPSTNKYYVSDVLPTIYKSNSFVLSNRFFRRTSGNSSRTDDNKYTYGDGDIWLQSTEEFPRLYIYKNDIATVENLKTWLSNNNITVAYPLATPIEESINLTGIELLDGYNTLSINTEVSPSNVKLTTSK